MQIAMGTVIVGTVTPNTLGIIVAHVYASALYETTSMRMHVYKYNPKPYTFVYMSSKSSSFSKWDINSFAVPVPPFWFNNPRCC